MNWTKTWPRRCRSPRKKPRNFAIIAKGQNVLKLLVDKKPIKEGALVKAKKEVQGNAIVKASSAGTARSWCFRSRKKRRWASPS